MDETKQNDKEDRGKTGSLRLHRRDEGEIADVLCVAGHAYQVVYPQESTWVFYLRLTSMGGVCNGLVRIVLGPKGATGSGSWSGEAKFFPAGEN